MRVTVLPIKRLILMNLDLARINARVCKIQGDCRNSASEFFRDADFRSQEVARVDAAIQTLRDHHIGEDLPDLSALQDSWDRFKSNISNVDSLEDIKSRIASLARVLSPPAPQAGTVAAAADPDVQATVDADEEAKAERLEAQKQRLPQEKPNLFKAIGSLARNVVDGKYGKVIKTACIEQHSSVVYRDAFLGLLLIEKSMNESLPHTQHEMEWDLSEEALERLNELQEEIKKISPEERISLLQKISSSEEVPLTENEKKLFDVLKEAVHLIKITKDEELIYPQLLYERVEEIGKVFKSYNAAFKKIREKPRTHLQHGSFLQGTIFKLGSADHKQFFYAIDRALNDLLQVEDPQKSQPVIGRLLLKLSEELENDPQIMKSFSKGSQLWVYLHAMMKEEDLFINAESSRLCMLMVPTLASEEPDLALKLTEKVLEFAREPKEAEEEFTLPPEFIQEVIKYQPQLTAQVIPYLSRQEVTQYFVQQIHIAKEAGRQAEIPELLERCRFEAQLFIKEILFAFWDESLRGLAKENADQAKIKIRHFFKYFRSELKEFFPEKSATEIEFDLLLRCLENPEGASSISPVAIALIPELTRIGKKEVALEVSRRILQEVKSSSIGKRAWRLLSYSILKASGLKWDLLDLVTFGPFVESENAGSYPLDEVFTALYLELMRSLATPELYINDVIDLSRSLDQLAREFRNESYREFSLQVTDLLKEILSKAFENMNSTVDPATKAKTLSRLVVGFSLVEERDRVVPVAIGALEEIGSSDFPEEQLVPMLKMLVSNLISSIKIIHKKSGSDAPEMQALKGKLIELVLGSIEKMPDVENRIEAFFDSYDQLEIEIDQDNDFYGGLCETVLNQALTDIRGWDSRGEFIQEKIQTLEALLELAAPLSEDLNMAISFQLVAAQMSLRDYRLIQTELSGFETRDDLDPVATVERCIELINQGQDPDTRGRILIIYQMSIDQVESPKQEELRSEMNAALAGSGRTSPEDED